MSEWIKLKAADGHELAGYAAAPAGEPVGAVVLVQEIFGVNTHIRSVADRYAAEGFYVVAPALFDRYERGVELGYGDADRPKAFELYGKLDPATALLDVAAAFHVAARQGKGTGVVGFCYGGLLAWLSATRGKAGGFDPRACVGYYAGGIGRVAAEEPSCPVMLHFGADDSHIGMDQIDAVRTAHAGHGEVEVYVYPGAGHAFNRDIDPRSYAPEAATLAGERTLAFLKKNLA